MGRIDLVRKSIRCSTPLAIGLLAVGCVVLMVSEGTIVVMAAAYGLLFAGLMIFGIRLLILQYRESPRAYPANRCKYCGYDLTGNVSGICPECGTKI